MSLYRKIGGLFMRIVVVFFLTCWIATNLSAGINPPIVFFKELGRSFSVSQNIPKNKEFQAFQNRLAVAEAGNAALLAEFDKKRDELSAPYLYVIAEYIYKSNPPKAVEWFWLGHLRARLDASLCADTTARQGISYLSGAAKNVASYIRTNPKKAGETGLALLTDKDLKSSKASPWWICVHGIKAMSNALQNQLNESLSEKERLELGLPEAQSQAPWLISREKMVGLYDKVLGSTQEYFQKLTESTEEKTQILVLAKRPRLVAEHKRIQEAKWVKSSIIYITKEPRESGKVSLWNNDKHKIIAEDYNTGLCVYRSKITYRYRPKEKTPHKRGASKTVHIKEAYLGTKFKELRFEFTEHALAPQGLKTKTFARWGQSPITCKWAHSSQIPNVPLNANVFRALGPGWGYLESVQDGTYHYADLQSKPVKISDDFFYLGCMKYHKFMDAVQLRTCPTGFRDRKGAATNDAEFNLAILKFESGRPVIEKTELFPIQDEAGQTQTLYTAKGIIRSMPYRNTVVGRQPGGLYWGNGGNVRKIFEGFISKVDVDETGCQIAAITTKNGFTPSSLWSIDICEGLPSS